MAKTARINLEEIRGYRNRDPGNIEIGDPWNGLMLPANMNEVQRAETRFCVFISHQHGIRAIAVILTTYQDKHGINTISGIVSRWAPDFENNVPAYVKAMEQMAGVGKNDVINVHDWRTMNALVRGIIRHELGIQPYTDAIITKGLMMAGIEPPAQGLKKSKTIKAATVVAGTGVATTAIGVADQVRSAVATTTTVEGVVEQVGGVVPFINDTLNWVSDNLWVLAVVGAVLIVVAAVVYYRRWDDQRQGFKP